MITVYAVLGSKFIAVCPVWFIGIILSSYIFCPSEYSPIDKVLQISIVSMGLSFKNNVAVSFVHFFIFQHIDE